MTQDRKRVLLIAVSKQLFSCQCARTHWNMCVLSLSATFLLHREWLGAHWQLYLLSYLDEQLKLPVRT